MKTIEEVKKEMDGLIAEYQRKESDVPAEQLKAFKKGKKAAKKRIPFLRSVQYYLETKPDPEVVKRQQIEVKRRMELVDLQIPQWAKTSNSKEAKALKAEIKKENNVKALDLQLRTLNYILS